MRVALLNPCYWPEVQRGSERLIRDLATDLVAAGHEPHLLTSHPGLPTRALEDGLRVTRHWRPPGARLRRRGFEEYLTHVPFSYASLALGHHEVAQAFYPTDALAATQWARRTGRPSVVHYGGIPRREVLAARRLRLPLLRRVLNDADGVIVYSEAAARGMRRWMGVEPRVINAGVRLDQFQPAPERWEQPTIASAADPADPRKRADLLVRAFARLRRARRDARLLLPRPASLGLARQLASADGVELFDPDPSAAAAIFPRAWVSALTSYDEAFGIVLLESLACGTPVVAAASGAVPEIVDRPSIGRLFDGDDEAAVAQALDDALELSSDPSTSEACRQRAGDFTTLRCTNSHIRLWEELVARRGL